MLSKYDEKKRVPRSRERGKGKNNKGTQRVQLQLSMKPEEREKIKELAAESNKSISSFILDKILER